jgi:CheY-like chemotaxis protein
VERAVHGFGRASAASGCHGLFAQTDRRGTRRWIELGRFYKRRTIMPTKMMRILFVGKPSPHTEVVLGRLTRKNLASEVVETLREARELIPRSQFDVVLAPEDLPDGGGYELADPVARRSCTLLIAISLSETWLWLPVVERGARVIGDRAVPADLLEPELEELLSERDCENSHAVHRGTPQGRPNAESRNW